MSPAAEERRKNPPSKVVGIMHDKDKYHHVTAATRPKLLPDHPGHVAVSHYAVTFEETIILRSSDFQLSDEGTSRFNQKDCCFVMFQFRSARLTNFTSLTHVFA